MSRESQNTNINLFTCVIFDSGASCSIVNNLNLIKIEKFVDQNINIYGTNRKLFTIKGVGKHKILKNIKVYYIPSFPTSIIAEVDAVDNYQVRTIYGDKRSNDQILIYEDGNVISSFTRAANKLYVMDEEIQVFISIREELNERKLNNKQIDRMFRVHELHKRTGYLSLDNLQHMLKHNAISGKFSEGEVNEADVANYKKHMHSQYCNGCNFAKMDSASSAAIDHRVIADLPGTLHADIMHINHDFGQLHYLTAIDEQSSMTFSVLINSLESTEICKAVRLIKLSYNKYKYDIETIHFDNERGINCDNTNHTLHGDGINTDYHTPGRHVRKAEAAIKLIKRTFKATIVGLDYPCPIVLYPYAIRWCIQCINLTSKESNPTTCPWTVFTGKKISFEEQFSAKFGDIVIVRANADDSKRPKTDKPVCTFGIILCRDENMRGTYIIMDLDTKRTIKRRQFKLYRGSNNATILNRIKSIGRASKNTRFGHIAEDEELSIRQSTPSNDTDLDESGPSAEREDIDNDSETNVNDEEVSEALNELGNITESDSEDDESDIQSIDNSNDDDNLFMEDGIADDADIADDEESMIVEEPPQLQPRRSARAWTPSEKSLERFMYTFPALEDNLSIRKSAEIYGIEETNNAIRTEVDNMLSKGVWTEIKPGEALESNNIVPSQLFLKAKFDAAGKFTKLKARLVACGNREKLEFNQTKVESPTANYNNILMLTHLATMRKMNTTIVDITAAYLHANIEGTVYMRINSDISNAIRGEQKPMIVRLNKCIYGLKQSGRKWFELLRTTFRNMRFRNTSYDECIFYRCPVNRIPDCWIVIYVDDIKIFADSKNTRQEIILQLEKVFGQITIQSGPEFSFLGLQITYRNGETLINQTAYSDKITSSIVVSQQGPSTPHRHDFKPISPNCEQAGYSNYKSDVMKLMFLATRTRPDIIYNAAILATKTNPTTLDIDDVQRLFKYVKVTSTEGLRFTDSKLKICMYCDAAFNVHEDRKSQSGYVIFMNNVSAPILFKSKKQSSLAQSSTEAEIIALFDGVRHLVLLVNLLEELGIEVNKPIPVWEDNMAVIELISSDKILKGNARFIDRKYFATRNNVQNGDIALHYVDTSEQVADCLTKAISGQRFQMFKKILQGTNSNSAEQNEMDDK